MKKILLIALVILITFSCAASAETMVWQTIRFNNGQKITVIFEYPEPMELGDEISFYCEFEGCRKEQFNYCWQYSGNGVWWTNFGSKARLNTTYSPMLAGKYIRLEVERK